MALENGERSFSFARKPGADTRLRKEEVSENLLKQTRIFHCGSLSLTDEPSRSATLYAVDQAKKNGVLISYDPNYRALLWKSPQDAMEQMRSIIPSVDIMKISDEETTLLTGTENPEGGCRASDRSGSFLRRRHPGKRRCADAHERLCRTRKRS